MGSHRVGHKRPNNNISKVVIIFPRKIISFPEKWTSEKFSNLHKVIVSVKGWTGIWAQEFWILKFAGFLLSQKNMKITILAPFLKNK